MSACDADREAEIFARGWAAGMLAFRRDTFPSDKDQLRRAENSALNAVRTWRRLKAQDLRDLQDRGEP